MAVLRTRWPVLRPAAELAAAAVIAAAVGHAPPFAAPLVAQARRAAAQSEPDSVLEYRVKAAYLLNFARYVEWPPDAYRSSVAPLTICVHGADPFGDLLVRTVRDRKTRGRAVAVRRTEAAADLDGCQAVFVGAAEWRRQPEVLADLVKRGILTVGEGAAFAEAGGVIGLVLEKNTVRFVVNVAAGEKAGLRLSSRMLSIASRVVGETKRAEP